MKRVHGVSLAVLTAAALAACGGGGGGSDAGGAAAAPTTTTAGSSATVASSGGATGTTSPTAPPVVTSTPVSTNTNTGTAAASGTSLQGTVAYGAPLAQAQVSVVDANGQRRSTGADAQGAYRLDVAGLVAPLLVTASGQSGDAALTYRALVAASPSGASVVNVTPLTDAIVALASSAGNNPAEFDDPARLRALDTARLAQAAQAVKTSVAAVAQAVGDANLDPQTSAFVADRASAGDKLLDAVKVSLHEGGVTLRNALVPLAAADSGAAATSVTLASATAVAQALPAPVLAENLTMFDTFVRDVNACLALAPAQRVATDMVGTPTAFAGACATVSGFSGSYRHNGRTLLQHWGQELRNVIPAGARLGLPEVLGLVKDGITGDTLAIVRFPLSSPAGAMSYVETARKLASGAWAIEGNQRRYEAGVAVSLQRVTDASTYPLMPTAGADLGKNVGRLSHYASRLHFHFDQTGPNGKNVYAVRVKGPGLPAAGVVLARSSSCGTHDHLAFYSNNGVVPSTPAVGATIPTAARSTSNAWTLRVAALGSDYTGTDLMGELRRRASDGSASTATTANVASAAVDLASVPMLARYAFEVFTAGSATPTDTFVVRAVTRPLAPEFGDRLPWAQMGNATKAWADPNNAQAAAAQNQAQLGWTLPAGAAPVTSGTVWGKGFDGSNILRQMLASAGVAAFGASSLDVLFRDPSGQTIVSRDGNGQSCNFDQLPAFEATKGAREVSLRQVHADGLVMHQVLAHEGRAAR